MVAITAAITATRVIAPIPTVLIIAIAVIARRFTAIATAMLLAPIMAAITAADTGIRILTVIGIPITGAAIDGAHDGAEGSNFRAVFSWPPDRRKRS